MLTGIVEEQEEDVEDMDSKDKGKDTDRQESKCRMKDVEQHLR